MVSSSLSPAMAASLSQLPLLMEADGSTLNGTDTHAGFHDAETNGDVPIAFEDEEVTKLRKQVELLSNEVKGSRLTIDSLDAQIGSYAAEREEIARRIEELQGELRVLGSVAERSAELEGEVARLQHDLISAMSGGEEASAEAEEARRLVDVLMKEKAALAVKAGELERRIGSLVAKKRELDAKVLGMSGKVTELEGLVKGFEEEKEKAEAESEDEVRELVEKLEKAVKELKEKDEHIAKARVCAADAMSELEELRESMGELKSSIVYKKTREAEDEATDKGFLGGGSCCLKYPWTVAAVSTGAFAVTATVLCLHYTNRSIWTIDLAYLLHKFSVTFSFFTVTLGANPGFSAEAFYKFCLLQDDA